MEPLIKKIQYFRKTGEEKQEFIIKEKDFGENIIYDIFFGDLFLFTTSADGLTRFGNWDAAMKEPVSLDKKSVDEICIFIQHIRR